MTSRHIAYIGLGANLGRPAHQIEQALWRLDNSAGIRLVAVSRFYRSKALRLPGTGADTPPQPDYINAVAAVSTSLPPRWLLSRLLRIERLFGRTRSRRWAPRTLDLDLLLYGRQCLQLPGLTVPHPEIHNRPFVLYPLRDIAPDLTLPGLGALQSLLQRCGHEGITVHRQLTG